MKPTMQEIADRMPMDDEGLPYEDWVIEALNAVYVGSQMDSAPIEVLLTSVFELGMLAQREGWEIYKKVEA